MANYRNTEKGLMPTSWKGFEKSYFENQANLSTFLHLEDCQVLNLALSQAQSSTNLTLDSPLYNAL